MIKASVIGATGYAGQELVRLLMRHPEVELLSLGSRSYQGQAYSDVYNNFRDLSDLVCQAGDIEILADQSDVIFLAMPHGIASKMVTQAVLEKAVVIDLGADYRLHDIDVYSEWYQTEHGSVDLLSQAVYGLCELHREQIKTARLIANPGCYTTCSILSLAPLIHEGLIDENSIIIDAKSGVSGAGRSTSQDLLFGEVNESIKAYKIGDHRHTPEIEQELRALNQKNFNVLFTPHLVPMNRGILAVSYATLKPAITEAQIKEAYEKMYQDEYFIRLTGDKMPETRWARGTNFVDIGFKLNKRTNRVVVVGAIDNLIKGAAGQAIQNMNIVFGCEEKIGIDLIADFPI
ncbi:MAG: N-acetyl-gamma-glutamyl-phosphate reductase [Eubacteriaceae bacterium]|nr:N-acetyl-gamma-glutamyl-phosphate reductase [Eubacteriaceae bacterium]MDK2937091.1 N-acetyl-gamma-glutamyl-phosphate reductase [Eubacteriaceae bacterium]